MTESGKDAVERKFTNTDNTSNNKRLDHMHGPKKHRHSESVSEHCCSVERLIVVSKIEGFTHTTTHCGWVSGHELQCVGGTVSIWALASRARAAWLQGLDNEHILHFRR